jgi:ribosome-associated protein
LKDLKKSQNLVHFIANAAIGKKGNEITILDLRKISTMVDYFIVITANGEIHARAIADDITKKLRKLGIRQWHVEGHAHGHWILLDYVDVVVHIFREEERAYYNIESLWGDAPTEQVGTEHE